MKLTMLSLKQRFYKICSYQKKTDYYKEVTILNKDTNKFIMTSGFKLTSVKFTKCVFCHFFNMSVFNAISLKQTFLKSYFLTSGNLTIKLCF